MPAQRSLAIVRNKYLFVEYEMYIPSKGALFSAAIFFAFAVYKFFIGSDFDLAIIATLAGVATLVVDYLGYK